MPAAVYILRGVVDEVMAFCRSRVPDEALGVLVGRRCSHNGTRYVRVTDWATGSTTTSPAHAEFLVRGVVEYNIELDEKYGRERAERIVGVFHSHPFGHRPALSQRDIETFTTFPYAAEGNVFALINPLSGHFLVYARDADGRLAETEWVEYAPKAPEA